MAPHLFSLPLGRRLRQHYENGGPWLACLLPIRGRRRCVDDVLNKGGGEGGGVCGIATIISSDIAILSAGEEEAMMPHLFPPPRQEDREEKWALSGLLTQGGREGDCGS